LLSCIAVLGQDVLTFCGHRKAVPELPSPLKCDSAAGNTVVTIIRPQNPRSLLKNHTIHTRFWESATRHPHRGQPSAPRHLFPMREPSIDACSWPLSPLVPKASARRDRAARSVRLAGAQKSGTARFKLGQLPNVWVSLPFFIIRMECFRCTRL
jgi:hypothetical protein